MDPDIEITGRCWINEDRPCDGGCVAYNTQVTEDEEKKWRRCMLARALYRGAEGLIMLAKALSKQPGNGIFLSDDPPMVR